MINWMPDFTKEIEKLSFPFMGAAMNAMMANDVIKDIKNSQKVNKLQPLRSNEQSMQLPGTSKTDEFQYTNSAIQRY